MTTHSTPFTSSDGDTGGASNTRSFVSAPPAYSTFSILALCLIVGIIRLLGEWVLNGTYPTLMLSSLLVIVGRYWLAFYLLALVVHVLLKQPWRETVRVVRTWVFLGIAVPIGNKLFGSAGSEQDYLWEFPLHWHWLLHKPVNGLSLGEAGMWWAVIFWATAYVAVKTRHPLKAAMAPLLVYVAVLFVLAIPASLAESIRASYGWPLDHRVVLLMLFQTVAALLVYFCLRPRLMKGLLWRSPHALPFTMFCFLGSAFYDQVSITTVIYAMVLFLIGGWVALGQNDYFDHLEDGAQGRLPYLNLEDVRFLTTTACFVIAILAAAHSTTAFMAFMTLSTAMLYNYPFYRAKRYFPSNLKIEGLWGFAAFAWGVVAAYENLAHGLPRWWLDFSPLPADPALLGPFDGLTIGAMFLALGGFSLVAILKDYKDWQADQAAGVQTLYTLAAKRGWSFRRVHTIVLLLAAFSLAIAPLLMAWGNKIPWTHAHGGVIAGGMVWAVMSGPPSTTRFRITLLILSLYFFYLVMTLSYA